MQARPHLVIYLTLQSRVLASFFASMLSYESRRKKNVKNFEIRLEHFFKIQDGRHQKSHN